MSEIVAVGIHLIWTLSESITSLGLLALSQGITPPRLPAAIGIHLIQRGILAIVLAITILTATSTQRVLRMSHSLDAAKRSELKQAELQIHSSLNTVREND